MGDPYATIATAANWGTAGTDAVLVAVALAGIYVLIRGSRILLGMIRR
jgi:hypothetical protein